MEDFFGKQGLPDFESDLLIGLRREFESLPSQADRSPIDGDQLEQLQTVRIVTDLPFGSEIVFFHQTEKFRPASRSSCRVDFFEHDEDFVEIVRLREGRGKVEIGRTAQRYPHDVVIFRIVEFEGEFRLRVKRIDSGFGDEGDEPEYRFFVYESERPDVPTVSNDAFPGHFRIQQLPDAQRTDAAELRFHQIDRSRSFVSAVDLDLDPVDRVIDAAKFEVEPGTLPEPSPDGELGFLAEHGVQYSRYLGHVQGHAFGRDVERIYRDEFFGCRKPPDGGVSPFRNVEEGIVFRYAVEAIPDRQYRQSLLFHNFGERIPEIDLRKEAGFPSGDAFYLLGGNVEETGFADRSDNRPFPEYQFPCSGVQVRHRRVVLIIQYHEFGDSGPVLGIAVHVPPSMHQFEPESSVKLPYERGVVV